MKGVNDSFLTVQIFILKEYYGSTKKQILNASHYPL
jgi:hypothetical protein